ncbi:MAG TPA: UDP-3-O-(3-hydroxymyristoyl)glucosamine N-acyltransferase [Phycisphaerae bacterium]|jgi:UDP-3-O-[3-hydroxymyristoyl] glucosamine N-acyltransferase|nr:UDP-3-O-(3-hydroxymyristoyl)glucosamine N-acyltransferase [Phycisphaerae bacterium]HOB75969.1 UDP-3-O-(3-hydroxymyristoyl)glucosamine N-acyltransferase [Phycisphaerae bacterium]HOJ55842.1 UDP-3-O-(3-hydroxymyristoyl)glucosamine N-acyltransferase [Phycisphaerae bacterium]HOL27815.1 UDP-3-O-(3-hydroxymyristoyl)glucosamine N-acyltransferase [Phycisphaerae bacterium]HPP22256.1 UDP-3-O-(3-hydroxymyristoyl)glucosamine N-acyltransferase [Phycisphaerae bacterium]
MSKTVTLAEIAKWVGGVVRGDASTRISGVAGVAEAGPDQLTWLAHDKYASQLRTSKAGAVLVPEQFGETPMPAVLCQNPAVAMVTILARFSPPVPRPAVGTHPTAVVASSAQIGSNVAIGPHVIIGENARVGDGCVLHASVFIGEGSVLGRDCELWPGVVVRERCTLGERVVVHPNAVIGADGFGYQFIDGRHVKIPQIGTVQIEDDVEIGANSCIDRAKCGATVIGRGTKIDNLVQVAHNVQIGPDCMIVAQTGIAGSARLGRLVVVGGQVGIRDHVTLHDGVQAAACSAISKDVPAGTTVMGMPAVEHEVFIRERAKIRRLPKMAEQLADLIKRVERLESSADHP